MILWIANPLCDDIACWHAALRVLRAEAAKNWLFRVPGQVLSTCRYLPFRNPLGSILAMIDSKIVDCCLRTELEHTPLAIPLPTSYTCLGIPDSSLTFKTGDCHGVSGGVLQCSRIDGYLSQPGFDQRSRSKASSSVRLCQVLLGCVKTSEFLFAEFKRCANSEKNHEQNVWLPSPPCEDLKIANEHVFMNHV